MSRGRHAAPAEVRFWQHVAQDGDCWVWTASVRRDGYGEFRDQGRLGKAHRFAYELMVGPIPEGLVLDHLCRNRACVNPYHLDPVPNRVNLRRGVHAHIARTGKCSRGHRMTEANIYVRPDTGQPICRECRRLDSQVRAAQNRPLQPWHSRKSA